LTAFQAKSLPGNLHRKQKRDMPQNMLLKRCSVLTRVLFLHLMCGCFRVTMWVSVTMK